MKRLNASANEKLPLIDIGLVIKLSNHSSHMTRQFSESLYHSPLRISCTTAYIFKTPISIKSLPWRPRETSSPGPNICSKFISPTESRSLSSNFSKEFKNSRSSRTKTPDGAKEAL